MKVIHIQLNKEPGTCSVSSRVSLPSWRPRRRSGILSGWVLLLLLLSLPACLQAQFEYVTNNGAITITGYQGSNATVRIPDTLAELPVTSIGNWAFYTASVTNVLISDNVTNIGDGAFFDCLWLTNVMLGRRVASVGDWTFAFCPNLSAVCCRGDAPRLGGDDVFYGNGATVYYLPGTAGWEPLFAGHPAVLWKADLPFGYVAEDASITITSYFGPGGAVTIPDSIEFLPVASIGSDAFFDASSITSITLPDSLTTIWGSAFSGCSGLTNITLPSSLSTIDFAPFLGCINLTAIIVEPGNPWLSSIDGVLFDASHSLLLEFPAGKAGSYAVPNTVTGIEDWAFYGCAHLTDVTLPNGATQIGRLAFHACTGLTNVALPNSVTSIGQDAFAMCQALPSIVVPNSVTNLGDDVFSDCTNLTAVTLPNSATRIPAGLFWNCPSLTNLTLPKGVLSIGDSAFQYCIGLRSIPVSDNLTSIGNQAFAYCLSLTNLALPGTVTNIGNGAFEYCTSLTNVALPNSVTGLGSSAFYNCTSLTNVVLSEKLNIIASQVFMSCSRLTGITIPPGVTNIDLAAFEGCASLTNLIIPSSVRSIGVYAFDWCSNLQTIFFEGNAPTPAPLFSDAPNVTVYHLPDTTGWEATFGGRPTALWLPTLLGGDASFGVRTNAFGFNIQWARGQMVVVEACTDLLHPDWQPVQTNTLTTGSTYFNDPQWTNYPGRFYRLRQ